MTSIENQREDQRSFDEEESKELQKKVCKNSCVEMKPKPVLRLPIIIFELD